MESITIYAYSTAKSPLSLAEYHEKLWPERLEQLSRFPEQSQQHSLAGDLLALMAWVTVVLAVTVLGYLVCSAFTWYAWDP